MYDTGFVFLFLNIFCSTKNRKKGVLEQTETIHTRFAKLFYLRHTYSAHDATLIADVAGIFFVNHSMRLRSIDMHR